MRADRRQFRDQLQRARAEGQQQSSSSASVSFAPDHRNGDRCSTSDSFEAAHENDCFNNATYVDVQILTVGAGRAVDLRVSRSCHVSLVKELIKAALDVPVVQQRLVWNDEILDDTALVRDLVAPNERTITITVVHAPKRLAMTGSFDKTLRLWDVDGFKMIREFHGHQDSVMDVAMNWSVRQAVSCSADGKLLIWDLENTEAVPKILKGHEGSVVCMAVDWASQRVASTGVDRTLRLWDMRDAAKVKVFHSESCIMCLCMDWATDLAVCGCDSWNVKLWDLREVNVLDSLRGHSDWVLSLAVDWESQRALSGSVDTTILLWDLVDCTILAELNGHRDSVRCLDAHWSQDRALSGSTDGEIRLWDLETGHVLRQFSSFGEKLLSLAADWAADCFLFGGMGRELTLRDMRRGEETGVMKGHTGWIRCAVFDTK